MIVFFQKFQSKFRENSTRFSTIIVGLCERIYYICIYLQGVHKLHILLRIKRHLCRRDVDNPEF